ncbi:unnamed protein product [Schistocephalus solidus]|uniref:Centrosomal protein of 162 kDa n=1 Tax=Schistocephalus solidus TaxID=70667 RepID=A0A183S7L5_SCHSO|nr:unnamed protein product [Schistocephalus solidus]
MDTFYNRLAAEVEEESDETQQSLTPKSKTNYKNPEISGDIDDLLDELDFTAKPKENKKTAGTLDFGKVSFLPRLYISTDNLVVSEPKMAADMLSLKENQNSSSSFSDTSGKPAKSKRNILDSLLSFDDALDVVGGDSGDYQNKLSLQENTSHEPLLNQDSNLGGSFSSGETKTPVRSDLHIEPPTTRPQTAPQQGRTSGGLENSLDFSDDFDLTSRRSRSRNSRRDFNTEQRYFTCGYSVPNGVYTNGSRVPVGQSSLPQQGEGRFAARGFSVVNDFRLAGSLPMPVKLSFYLQLYDTPSLNQFINSTPKDSPDPAEAKLAQRVKHLEVELDGARKLLKMAKGYHQEEIKLLEESHALKEEMEFSIGQFRDRITQMEQYHEALRKELVTSVAAAKSDATRTVESLRAEHSAELEALLAKNQQTLANLRQATLDENKTISELQPSAQSLRDLLEQLIRAVGDLQKGEDERQVEKDLESAHHCLTEQVAKLEVQLREQSKLLADVSSSSNDFF